MKDSYEEQERINNERFVRYMFSSLIFFVQKFEKFYKISAKQFPGISVNADSPYEGLSLLEEWLIEEYCNGNIVFCGYF